MELPMVFAITVNIPSHIWQVARYHIRRIVIYMYDGWIYLCIWYGGAGCSADHRDGVVQLEGVGGV